MSRKKRRRKAKDSSKPSAKYIPQSELSPDDSVAESDDISSTTESPSEEALVHDSATLEPPKEKDESNARLPGFFAGTLELPKDRSPWWVTVVLILVAYSLAVHVRMSWIEMAMSDDRASMRWEGQPTPNTHDSFYFAAILQKAHLGMHQENDLVPSVVQNGMITMLSYGLLQIFPSLTIEQLLLWFTVYASGLVCVPVVLVGRLYGSVIWGFFAACIAGVAHSYFNRTLAGYYDTDVFSVSAAAFALMFLLYALRRKSLFFAFVGALGCFLYPLFYNRVGIPIALGLAFVGFQLFQAFSHSHLRTNKGAEHRFHLAGYVIVCLYFAWFFAFQGVFGGKFGSLMAFVLLSVAVLAPVIHWIREKAAEEEIDSDNCKAIVGFAWRSTILVGAGTATCAFSGGTKLEPSAMPFYLCLVVLFMLYAVLSKISLDQRILAGVGSVALVFWVVTANPLQSVFQTAEVYTQAKQGSGEIGKSVDKTYNLNFRNTLSTVREAGSIPWRRVLTRITADYPVGAGALAGSDPRAAPYLLPMAVLALIGYGLLVLRHWEFLLALPFIGIGLYAHWGGLRFTVHATAVAALGATYLALSLPWAFARLRGLFWGKAFTWIVGATVTFFFVWPNVKHAETYSKRINVVFPEGVIESLKTLEKKSSEGDFVVTWWDYGSGTWVYSGCRTFSSPAHHGERGPDNFLISQVLRTPHQAQSANLARLMTEESAFMAERNQRNKTNYRTAARSMFRDGTSDVIFYPKLFEEAKSKEFPLPPKTRETYLFLHYETLRIFGTVAGFSQRNLLTPEIKLKAHNVNGLQFPSPFGMVLSDPKKEGTSVVFAQGSYLDEKGNLHYKVGNATRILPVNVIQQAGEPRSSQQSLLLGGESFTVSTVPRSPMRLVHAPNPDRIFIMDEKMRRSTLVRKYLLDQYDQDVVGHPSFEKFFSENMGRGKYYFLPTSYRAAGRNVTLQQSDGQGRVISLKLDLATFKATMHNGIEVPFSYHHVIYRNGKSVKIPTPKNPDAQFHAIQFTYPWETREKGFVLMPNWIFLHDELFRSTVVQGFIMENLDPELFEPVHLSPWAKIYRVNR